MLIFGLNSIAQTKMPKNVDKTFIWAEIIKIKTY
jgi:hypothetical protein